MCTKFSYENVTFTDTFLSKLITKIMNVRKRLIFSIKKNLNENKFCVWLLN